MSLCGTCRHIPPSPAVLFSIREGFRAKWHDLTFSVESDGSQWTLQVQGSGNTLYTAHRSGAKAARLAAADFASFQGAESELNWQSYW